MMAKLRRWAIAPAAAAAMALLGFAAWAQEPPKAEPAKPAAKEKEKEKILPPEKVTLNAPDMTLTATYFPGPKGKDSVPVVLLHMFKRNRNDYDALAKYLQSQGHAVLVPDLRGHGDSTTKTIAGTSETLDPQKFTKTDYARDGQGRHVGDQGVPPQGEQRRPAEPQQAVRGRRGDGRPRGAGVRALRRRWAT